jgi:RNA polymerase sigma-70 factor, ECF subfamily
VSESSTSVCDLLRRARDGDGASRELLFEKCRNYVRVVAQAQVEGWMQSKVDASDLVQQTLLDAHRAFGDFRGDSEGEWLVWLRRILQHNAVDFVRRHQGTEKRRASREVPLDRRRPGDSFGPCIDPSDHGETPSQLLVRHEREIAVAEAISQLSEDHQQVIMLRNLQRLPFDEVADRMGRSRPAVQMLWTRALRKLESILKQARP